MIELRDLIALVTLHGMLGGNTVPSTLNKETGEWEEDRSASSLSKMAYFTADKMLAERAKARDD